ncbi:MAG: GNAT family N-acetyltransferase [Candidatus Oleimicrobiaceae bacterium]
MRAWSVRRLANSLADADGILSVEKETIGECPYTPEELLARLTAPDQRVWLAEAGSRIVGFLAGLCTPGLGNSHVEADLLAVHPAWRGKGIATALLTALRRDAAGVPELRGAVRPANLPSSRAFARAGFRPFGEVCDLLLYRILGRVPRATPAWGGTVRRLSKPEEAFQAEALAPELLPPAEHIYKACQQPSLTLLGAFTSQGLAGVIELVEVHTLLYSGLWLESAHARLGQAPVLAALSAAAIELAKERDLDSVGCLVPQSQSHLRETLRREGFVPLDSYRIWKATPLPAGEAP